MAAIPDCTPEIAWAVFAVVTLAGAGTREAGNSSAAVVVVSDNIGATAA